jgi:hypothetical protein
LPVAHGHEQLQINPGQLWTRRQRVLSSKPGMPPTRQPPQNSRGWPRGRISQLPSHDTEAPDQRPRHLRDHCAVSRLRWCSRDLYSPRWDGGSGGRKPGASQESPSPGRVFGCCRSSQAETKTCSDGESSHGSSGTVSPYTPNTPSTLTTRAFASWSAWIIASRGESTWVTRLTVRNWASASPAKRVSSMTSHSRTAFVIRCTPNRSTRIKKMAGLVPSRPPPADSLEMLLGLLALACRSRAHSGRAAGPGGPVRLRLAVHDCDRRASSHTALMLASRSAWADCGPERRVVNHDRATQTPASPKPTMSARPSPVESARKRGCWSTRQPPAL